MRHESGAETLSLRIGVVQSAEKLRLALTGPARAEGTSSHQLGPGQYTVRLHGGAGAGIRPFWLVRAFLSRFGAERCSSALPGSRVIETGETREACGVVLTTREYWVVTEDGEGAPNGWRTVTPGSIQAELVSDGTSLTRFQRLTIAPEAGAAVVVGDVLTGAGFHWQHGEDRTFRGHIEVTAGRHGRLCLVNVVDVEQYLLSVATSEMRSYCPAELLRAQTVAARSWLLARLGKVHLADPFDLCAEDHCQCYRGIERESMEGTAATKDTWGQVLTVGGRICDARYSKVCGGLREGSGSVWGGRTPPYLGWGIDAIGGRLAGWERGVRSEADAGRWIGERPACYCNPDASRDEPCVQEFGDYFRWTVHYDGEVLGRLVNEHLEGTVGHLTEIRPLRRGRSGRIELLEIRGSKGTRRVGRELRIRRVLSETHLPSSAFVCHQTRDAQGYLKDVVFQGAGWGHGVGMCQVGAAAMAHHGHHYRSILSHYYPGTTLAALYASPPAAWPEAATSEARVPCWVQMNCYELRRCPVHVHQSPEPCWERRGSPRLGRGMLDPAEKRKDCRRCPYFDRRSR